MQSRPAEHINLKTMCAMKKKFISIVAMVAIAATATFTSCVSSLYSSANSYDDLYAIHDVEVIAARQKAEAEVRQAEAEARRAEALALQAEYEAQLAKQNVTLAQNAQTVQQAQPVQQPEEPQEPGILDYWPVAVAAVFFFGGSALVSLVILLLFYKLRTKDVQVMSRYNNGEITKAVTVRAAKFSAAAVAKIEAAGGKAEVAE